MSKARCPRCDSPSPELHPAMQAEGEVQPCQHEWHHFDRQGRPLPRFDNLGREIRT